jgi:hypothetical protein
MDGLEIMKYEEQYIYIQYEIKRRNTEPVIRTSANKKFWEETIANFPFIRLGSH